MTLIGSLPSARSPVPAQPEFDLIDVLMEVHATAWIARETVRWPETLLNGNSRRIVSTWRPNEETPLPRRVLPSFVLTSVQ
jgi:hypothetical protein